MRCSARCGEIHYTVEGAPGAPPLLLLHSLGVDLGMWDAQIKAFTQHFRVIRYDARGHGLSDVGRDRSYSMAMLAEDAIAVLDAVDVPTAHWCGLSLGGMTAMWAASYVGERVAGLALCNTSAHMPPASMWHSRMDVVRREGMQAVVPAVLERWFTPKFRRAHPEQVARIQSMLLATPAEGYAAACGAIASMDQLRNIRSIAAPTLVICGAADPATPLSHSKAISDAIPGAQLTVLPAAHLSNIEQPEEFAAAVCAFLKTVTLEPRPGLDPS